MAVCLGFYFLFICLHPKAHKHDRTRYLMCGGFYRDKERKLTHSQTARDDAGKIKRRVGTLLTFLRTGNVENAVA